jgi:hypothetical protein
MAAVIPRFDFAKLAPYWRTEIHHPAMRRLGNLAISFPAACAAIRMS